MLFISLSVVLFKFSLMTSFKGYPNKKARNLKNNCAEKQVSKIKGNFHISTCTSVPENMENNTGLSRRSG